MSSSRGRSDAGPSSDDGEKKKRPIDFFRAVENVPGVDLLRRSPPSNLSWRQQRLRSCQPILTPFPVIFSLFLVALLFVPTGVLILVTSYQVVEQEVRYDNACGINTTCNVTMKIDSRMEQPVYMYYKLTNFYQNHRRYVSSRSDAQLRGDSNPSTDSCTPLEETDDGCGTTYTPCGLVAWSQFNDSIAMYNSRGNLVHLRKQGIAWDSDVSVKFNNPPPSDPPSAECASARLLKDGVVVPDFKDEDFIVWMRTAALPTFRKLYRRIEFDLEPGTYTFSIDNVFPTASFDGHKSIILSTSSWLGGSNKFLGWGYLSTGTLSLLFALLFCALHIVKPRRLGDPNLLGWE